LQFGEHESTQMPFRYVKGEDGKPVMPEVSDASLPEAHMQFSYIPQGMIDLIRNDADKAIDDLL
jgi:hypothetical protein